MTLRRTAGGRFDPADRLCYFVAASSLDYLALAVEQQHPYILVAVNELQDRDLDRVAELSESGARVFLDSGIFNLTNEHVRAHPGVSMDEALALPPEQIDGFDQLYARYVKYVRRLETHLWGAVELDQGGVDHKRRTRARLEDELGLSPVPVYHPFNDGWDYFDELAEQYDRLCFGNVVQADREQRKRLVATAWERHRRYPNLWVHLLGLTPNEWLNAMPVDSADSSTWLAGLRFVQGQVDSAAMKTLGSLPRNFRYELRSDPTGPTGVHKAINMSAVYVKAQQRNWRNQRDALRVHLGADTYPPPLNHERPLR